MPASAQGLHRGCVFAADDCPTMRELMRASLERLGYRVQAVEAETFDAIVLDVEMPGMHGMATGHALHRAPGAAAAMIALHSSLDEEAVRKGFAFYDAFVPKSGGAMALGEQVDGWLRSHRPGA